MNSPYLRLILEKYSQIRNYKQIKKYKKNTFRFGDAVIILGAFLIPIVPVSIMKNLYMDFWKFTLELRDLYRTWLLFVNKNLLIN
jgi:hypothetical protein